MFDLKDIQRLQEHGIAPEAAEMQIQQFRKGFPCANLKKPCTVGDGIRAIPADEAESLVRLGSEVALQGRVIKFVPASGAATRMFQSLFAVESLRGVAEFRAIREKAKTGESSTKDFLTFADNLRRFAFFDDLKGCLAASGHDIGTLIEHGDFAPVLEALLRPQGLNYANLPKGLLPFHRYPDRSRTPIEEHLVEALACARDRRGTARIHFTVSPEHRPPVEKHIAQARSHYEATDRRLEVTLSVQDRSTDTLAATPDNRPFRDTQGNLAFRPGGHGALLKNLNELQGDIVLIKNIDNVVPDPFKGDTYTVLRLLAGLLAGLQTRIFGHLELLRAGRCARETLRDAADFCRQELSAQWGVPFTGGSDQEKRRLLSDRLNRPLRVCGVVKNEGEPGGGPFWVQGADGSPSLQIVESSQVDMKSPGQQAVWKSSTHFNPVTMACGVRDHIGKPFDLAEFRDPDTGIIAVKSKDGAALKAMELPGLWNGSMAHWNTVFVEIPVSAFNPVKTVLDLLRDAHQVCD